MIAFHLDPRSGAPTYLQLVQQVRHALRMDMLQPGDQLPTTREVVASLVINPNTVLKAYRELEREGLVEPRPGQGTFVVNGLPGPSPSDLAALRGGLLRWLRSARAAGLDDDSLDALWATSLHDLAAADVA